MVRGKFVTAFLLLSLGVWLPGSDRCLPIQPEEPLCTYGGEGYGAGDTFPALDGCNTCSCEAGGAVTCTEFPCGPDAPGVYLIVDQVAYPEGARIQPTWWNHTDEAIFLAGCTTYSVEEWDEQRETWIDRGPPAVCVWEGYAVKVLPGDAREDFTGTYAAGTRRLRGQYWLGCLDGEPISEAECEAGPIDIYSRVFETYPAP